MKSLTKLILMLLMSIIAKSVSAQVPHLIHFQAIAHDATGGLVIGKTVDVQLQIFDSAKGGTKTILYWEQQAVPTDNSGYFDISINDSDNKAWNYFGSYLKFSQIPWKTGHKWLKILYAPDGVNFNSVGTLELISTPYSLVSQTALGIDGVVLTGATNGQVLTWNGSNWAPGTVSPGGTPYNAGNGISISSGNTISVAPGKNTGDVLAWNGSAWVSNSIPGVTPYTAGNGISISSNTISVAPGSNNGDVLTWNAATSSWVPGSPSSVIEIDSSSTIKSSTLIAGGCSGNATSATPKIYATAPSDGLYLIMAHGTMSDNSTTAVTDAYLFIYNINQVNMLYKCRLGRIGQYGASSVLSSNIQTIASLKKGDKIELQFANADALSTNIGFPGDQLLLIKLK